MAMKRGRTDGHLTKGEIEELDQNDPADSYQVGFAKATPNTLASRRMVVAQRKDKKELFARHLVSLNKSFHSWLKEQIAADPYADLSDGFQDYVDHVTSLEDRYLRSYGEVLTFGSGDCGQLAHGTERDEDLMVKYPRTVYSLRDKKVVGIACGGIHNAVYTEAGQVFTWGCADDGTLGRRGDESVPMLVEGLAGVTVVGIACGDSQTMCVTTQGEVWGWGCYKDKEGKKWFNPAACAANPLKDIKKQQNDPMPIAGLQHIVEVACGAAFNLARDAEGRVFSWGLGECGELGRAVQPMRYTAANGEKEYDLPHILQQHLTPGRMFFEGAAAGSGAEQVKSFGCGAYHSLLTVVGDRVYACGLNNYGQLGLGGTENKDFLCEVKALYAKGVVCVRGGMHHSLALSSAGVLYAFGRGDSGQLGSSAVSISSAGDFSALPVKVLVPSEVVGVDCGGNHNLAVTRQGEVYSWGYGDMLALGHGDERDEFLPKKVNFQKAGIARIEVSQVAGGGQHSAIVGKVHAV